MEPHCSRSGMLWEMTMPSVDPATLTLLKLTIQLIGIVGGLVKTSILHRERFRAIHEQLVAMKAAIEQGQVLTDAKLAEISNAIHALRSETFALIAEEA